MGKLGKWFKQRELSLLHLLLIVYVFFIPLWPKLPLQFIEYTYVHIRYEDLFIALLVLVFVIDLVRGKISITDNPLFKPIIFYWLIVLVAFFVGFYVLETIVSAQLGFLHAFRRIEYMIVFFIIYAAIKNQYQVKLYLNSIIIVLLLTSIYGVGQKILGWPAVQTMNPHYAKGYLLTLDANARISSTFGGHYDFAAYLVFLMPITIALYIVTQAKRYFVVFVIALLALILTASRVSYVAYLVSIPLFLLWARRFKLLLVIIVLTALLTPLSQNLTKRINRTFRQELVWVSQETGQTIVPREITADDLPPGDYVIKKGGTINKKKSAKSKEALLVKKELRGNILKDAQEQGRKLTEKQINALVEQAFQKLTPVSSILPDISLATRFQVEWPRAINAFVRNPFTGTGPSSITEATDNDYLRALGEVGLIGFLFFFYIITKICYLIWQKSRKVKFSNQVFLLGVVFGTWALLVNALYIDVFEASKVAFTIWFVWGLMLKTSSVP